MEVRSKEQASRPRCPRRVLGRPAPAWADMGRLRLSEHLNRTIPPLTPYLRTLLRESAWSHRRHRFASFHYRSRCRLRKSWECAKDNLAAAVTGSCANVDLSYGSVLAIQGRQNCRRFLNAGRPSLGQSQNANAPTTKTHFDVAIATRKCVPKSRHLVRAARAESWADLRRRGATWAGFG